MLRIAMISTPFIPVPPRDYGGTELIVHELNLLSLDGDRLQVRIELS